MTLHKEGNKILITTLIVCIAIVLGIHFGVGIGWLTGLVAGACAIVFFLFAQFFRVPKRIAPVGEDLVICPADGKVVVIEEVEETEYLKKRCIQISIFMSPLNVHVNWYPVGGDVSYYKYHAGKYLVAWHPKSSTENERSTVVVKRKDGMEVLFRQVAGAVARRIVTYAKEGHKIAGGDQFGFIKFGSRIDIYLPLDADIKVKIDDVVKGKQDIIATIPTR